MQLKLAVVSLFLATPMAMPSKYHAFDDAVLADRCLCPRVAYVIILLEVLT
jgi:hypothetical protein